jgi:MscS family membrane protein
MIIVYKSSLSCNKLFRGVPGGDKYRVTLFIPGDCPVSVLFVHEMKEWRPFLKMRLKAYVLDIRYEFDFKSEMTEIVLHELYKQGLIRKEEA